MWKGCWLLTCVAGLASVGCLGGPRTDTPLYAVSWNDEARRGGIHISIAAANDHSRLKDVIRLNRNELPALDICLFISNHTGRELFVAALDESLWLCVRWTSRSVNEAGEVVQIGHGYLSTSSGVGPSEFVRLCPWPPGQKQVVCDRPLFYDVYARVSLPSAEEYIRYTDIEIEVPLHYYALGATEPARIMAKHTMRVEYRD